MRISEITDSEKAYNEDSYGHTKHGFWVMDGASSLSKENFTPDGNDVHWIVNWWKSYLRVSLDNLDKHLIQILEEGIDKLNDEFSQYADINTLSKLDRSSSSFCACRIIKDEIEFFVLGDVEILVSYKKEEQSETSKLDVFTDKSIECLDNSVMKLIRSNKNRNSEIVFSGFTREELDLLRKNRNTMNTENGYWILEHDREAVRKGIYEKRNKKDIKDILMMTDGFTAIYNKYEYVGTDGIIKLCKDKGVKGVIDIIRDIEKSDEKLTEFVRLKKHDDATATLIEL